MTPKVLNKNMDRIPRGAVYVGRGSSFGNPFKSGRRDYNVMKFKAYLLSNPELLAKVKLELRGKDLVCLCAPAFCHAEILMEIANGT